MAMPEPQKTKPQEEADVDRPIDMLGNPLPRYYTLLFAGLVLWAVLFAGWFLFSGWSSQEEFAGKMQASREQAEARAAAAPSIPPAADSAHLRALGGQLYADNCAACHGADGGGGIGPALTAATYRYGKEHAAVQASIDDGRPGGMPGFGNQLSPEQIEALVLYVTQL